ncbi:NUDIX hydrolase [Nocardia camponoti]|uniref:8-oxo-dGTP diphosphatase n=1 Tax=Nocardia camponoti TaxID=1616106 RepID=A0A917QJJ7_9NOCA|nr:NUDIX hydrolase [Nocardia camponoti]GGK52068.1 8-oxo-dGTP diphosphatase [Nocardia camponoti]
MLNDGNGWSEGPDGEKYWGRFGAAGLLLRAPLPSGLAAVLLQHRAEWSHQGDTWALPGGARDSHETPEHAALRETNEEAGLDAADIRVRAERVTHVVEGGWTYTTVIADTSTLLPTVTNKESVEVTWIPEDEVAELPLHPAFALAWPTLRAKPFRVIDPDPEVAALLPCTVEVGDDFVWLTTAPEVEALVLGEATVDGLVVSREQVLAARSE